VLNIEDLCKSYGSNRVLDGITFNLKKREKVVIMGKSGTGKSTLLRCINRLIEPDAGKIYLYNTCITSDDIDITKIRRRIGMVFQHFELFPHLTALNNVTIGLIKVLNFPKDKAEKLAFNTLKKVGLKDKAHSYPGELSGGEKQRVDIARALAMNPELMMFDEPTSALDPFLVGEVLDTMKELADEGLTMLIVSHEVGFIKEVADRILIMHDGKIIESAPPQQIFEKPKHKFTKMFLKRILV
jgi:ABC-type polar amino acid transport system ATPase subunit